MIPTTVDPVVFHIEPQLRMRGGPKFSSQMQRTESGDTQTNAAWSEALWEWTCMFKKGSREFGSAMGFYLARLGPARGFFFQDPFDHTNSDNGGTGLVKTMPDGNRYLVKKYPDVDSYNPYYRIIKRPVSGTVTLTGVSGSPVLSYTTGQITGASSDGTASFEFLNPVVFASDIFEVERNPAVGEWQNVVLSELRSYVLGS